MNKLWLFIPCAFLMTGCTTVTDFRGPSGVVAYNIECENLNACYQTAGNFCPNGYEILNTATTILYRSNFAVECTPGAEQQAIYDAYREKKAKKTAEYRLYQGS